jgi:hypothetical protein
MERVHGRVRAEAEAVSREQDPLALTRRVIAGLGLPDAAANPVTARASAGHCHRLALDLQML